jgi:hypothetical protein
MRGWSIFRFVGDGRRARHMLARTYPLGATTPEGTVAKITGSVRVLAQPLVAPLSDRPCVVYRSYAAFRIARTNTPHVDIGDSQFAVDTADGPVLVDSAHAVLDVEPVRLEVTKARREQFRVRLGLPVATRAGFTEYIVSPGDEISVIGLMMVDPATDAPGDERGFREAPPGQRRLTGNPEHPVVISAT